MVPWQLVAQALAPDGTQLVLMRRGGEWEVRAGGDTLMSSRTHASEEALAEIAFECAPRARRVLVGGLGLGFTLRATLERLPRGGRVVVAELSPALVEWNRAHVAALAGRPLDDARTELRLGDVGDVIRASAGAYDAILLDVDNGPAALIHRGNARLYSDAGVRATHAALTAGGVLAVWATRPDDGYVRRLRRAGFEAEARSARARPGRGAHHIVFVARKPGPSARPSRPRR
jgi:spermidine synthase